MVILFLSSKGGVGKTSLGYSMAVCYGFRFMTNDATIPSDPNVIQLAAETYRIPAEHRYSDRTIIDFGAMSNYVDRKLVDAFNMADIVVIPTLTDELSLQAVKATVELVRSADKPFVVVINNYTNDRLRTAAEDWLAEHIGNCPIFSIRRTTLFERVSRDGKQWLNRVYNKEGHHRLVRTLESHLEVYDRILANGRFYAQVKDNR